MPDICAAPSTTGDFPGFGEGAPLDLSGASPAAVESMLSRLLDGTAAAFSETLASVGNCSNPIRLVGSSTTVDRASGEVTGSFSSADAPLGELYVPCGNRRASYCPACSRTYARDTFELIRAGVVGGKTVPPTVAAAPLLFVTLTAPSFGYVHGTRPDGGKCRPRSGDRVERCPHGVRMACNAVHDDEDEALGAPLCWDCYDWTSAVVWQWHAPELWRRTTIALRRQLARALGVPASRLRLSASVQYAKVGEYQARGLIHFHVLVRLDGPDGPGSPAPFDADTLAQVVVAAARSVTVTAPPTDEHDRARVLAWGRQLDVKTVTTGRGDVDRLRAADTLTPEQVAGYLAKYATKDTGDLRHDGGATMPAHLSRLAAECHRLHDIASERSVQRRSGVPSVVPVDADGLDHYALIGKWAHMLGFRGHFATKSRTYSVTLGRLRRARARYRRLVEGTAAEHLDTRQLEALLLADDEDETTLVLKDWRFSGTGWRRPADAVLAGAAAARAREYDRWKSQQRKHTRTTDRADQG